MKIYSSVLRQQMKSCILAIFWPRKTIFKFFEDCSVPRSTLKSIEDWEGKGLSRARMIDQIFDSLDTQADNGTMQFRIMFDTLSHWSYFDDYWFKDQQKLDLDDAKKKIAALKLAHDSHIDVAKKRAEDHRAKALVQDERHKSLEEMRQEFWDISMNSGTPQARGYAFEKFLGKMARFFGLQVTGPFKIEGMQIDGTVKYDGENYSLEAKWEHQMMSNEPLFAFCHKLEISMHPRGIFISVNSFTPEALSLLERSKVKNIVLMDGEDITLILDELITLPQALDKKIHAAQTRGQFYVHPITGKQK